MPLTRSIRQPRTVDILGVPCMVKPMTMEEREDFFASLQGLTEDKRGFKAMFDIFAEKIERVGDGSIPVRDVLRYIETQKEVVEIINGIALGSSLTEDEAKNSGSSSAGSTQ